jgi:hypothetical protein
VIISVSKCSECPFINVDYESGATCNLPDGPSDVSELDDVAPHGCPLRTQAFTVELKNRIYPGAA